MRSLLSVFFSKYRVLSFSWLRPQPTLTNTVGVFSPGGSAQANVPLSIPRFFRKGEIANYAQPTINDNFVETWQCDVKNRWDDGSLKFAVVSLVVPPMSAKHQDTIGFANSPNRDSGLQSGVATGYLKKTEMLDPAYDFEATIVLAGAVSHTISARVSDGPAAHS